MPNQIVVAGALIAQAALLVAQRERPPELAGLWELPGGKVAPGESDAAGDGLAFLCALAFAVMIVITRWRHEVSMAPATCLSQVILVVAFAPFATP